MQHTAISPATARAPSLRRRHLPTWLLAVPLLVLLVLPLLALILRANRATFAGLLVNPVVVQALWLSLSTTLISTALALLLGTPLAYVLARRSFRGKRVIDALLDLPMVLPPSVAGIALLVTFGRRGLLGPAFLALDVDIAFTQIAVVLAQLFVAAPYYVKSAAAGLATVDRELEQAAALDGADRTGVLRYITLPLALPALLSGAIMTWARALGEFGATIIFAGNFPGRTQTMPLAIYLGFERDIDLAIGLAVVLLAVSFGVLLAVKWLAREQP